MRLLRHCTTLALALLPSLALSQARFDLAGPKIDVHVTRGGVTLPISKVPNLQAGDQLWLHPDFPADQSAHYLLIATFLRGTTNPPPDNWFVRIETWDRKVKEEGVSLVVPDGAQQAILFLAPETSGDFGTLRSAVKGRPGTFVRASQDLAEAGFEQARIEQYLASMKLVPPADAAAIQEHSNLLARTLNLRPNPDCYKRPLDQQFNCLTQTGSQMLLDDGHAQTIVAALSTGPGSDFINAASNTRLAAGGNYSAYVGAVVDLARLLNGIHTAQYQYIPAIAFPDLKASPETLNLRLNTPPSFHNPKSVIVIGLPPVLPAALPPLRPAEPDHISCLLDPKMVLPIEGAPLVFSTAYAHDLKLHLNVPGKAADIPLAPDAYQGGLTIVPATAERRELPVPPAVPVKPAPAPTPAGAGPNPAASTVETVKTGPGEPITGTILGMWGFDSFTGPTLPLQQVPGQGWRIVPPAGGPEPTLIAGQPNHLQLISTGTACLRTISLEPGSAPVEYKLHEDPAPPKADVHATVASAPAKPVKVQPVDLTLNLQHAATPGSIRLAILQYGETEPDHLGTKSFSEPAKLEGLQLHAGDTTAVLTGTSLGQVKSLSLKDETFTPARPAAEAGNSLTLAMASGKKAPGLKVGEKVAAKVQLEDGRTLEISTFVLPERPELSLLSRRVVSAVPSPIQLSSPDDLPLGSQLVFFLKSRAAFQRTEQVELASVTDETLHTTLTVASGALVLQDQHTVLATFDPMKTFGASTFGAFRMRAVTVEPGGNTPGEWMPLATIVRLPTLTSLTCPADVTASCLLTGQGLYLIDSVSPDLGFGSPTKVPEGFVDAALAIPHVAGGVFYLRLRDDMATTHMVTLPVTVTPAVAPVKVGRVRVGGVPHGE